jgi:outer membrane phospholipase A
MKRSCAGPSRKAAYVFGFALATSASQAGAQQAAPGRMDNVLATDRFGFHEENFFLYQRMRNNGWAGKDEWALRGHYSVKFRVLKPDTKPDRSAHTTFDARKIDCELADRDAELFLSYTGEFDFYLNSRPSGPVINRLSNPAVHYRFASRMPAWLGGRRGCVDVGVWEHRSDGQVTEVTLPADAAAAQRAYDARDRPFFDQISRGSDYLSLSTELYEAFGVKGLALRPKIKLYLKRDSEITWGPLAGQGRSISSYDRLSILARYMIKSYGAVELQWTVGDKGFKTDSFDLGWQTTEGAIVPLYVRVHIGPMNTLSNYTQRQDSIGVGLKFTGLGM